MTQPYPRRIDLFDFLIQQCTYLFMSPASQQSLIEALPKVGMGTESAKKNKLATSGAERTLAAQHLNVKIWSWTLTSNTSTSALSAKLPFAITLRLPSPGVWVSAIKSQPAEGNTDWLS